MLLSIAEKLVSFTKRAIIITLLVTPWSLRGQGVTNHWLMGYGCDSVTPRFGGGQINFLNNYPDTSFHCRTMNFSDCNANISDSSGNLLFYTNGIYIANALDDTMLNGDNINPGTYTSQQSFFGLRVRQGDLILPMPDSAGKYYLFHETMYYNPTEAAYRTSDLFYSIIDMALDSGRGAVTQKNIVVFTDTLNPGCLAACKHANGRDWWIVSHKGIGNRYFKFLVTPNGVSDPFVQDIGYSSKAGDWVLQSCFSEDGNWFSEVGTSDSVDIMKFDRCSGLLSQCQTFALNDSGYGHGVAFSPNSRYCYITSLKYIYQFDLTNPTISNSKVLLVLDDGYVDPILPFTTGFWLAKLAYDNKIYITTSNTSTEFNVIYYPDSNGLSCNFIQHNLQLPTTYAWTVPNFPNYFLGAETGTVCDSLSRIIHHTYVNSVSGNKQILKKPTFTGTNNKQRSIPPRQNSEYFDNTQLISRDSLLYGLPLNRPNRK